MKPKTKIFCILTGMILILVGLTPVTISESIITKKYLSIQTTIFNNGNPNKITTDLSFEEAEKLKETLLRLNNAITENDQKTIQICVTKLKNYGIIDDVSKLKLFPEKNQEEAQQIQKNPKFPILKRIYDAMPTNVIDNTMCIVNIAGKGFLLFTIGTLLMIPTVILIDMFSDPILNLLIPLYVIIAIITHAIPFRILLPVGIVNLESGSISTRGANGNQQINATNQSITTYLLGFTGITINIPFGQDAGFTFVAGFSMLARADYS